MPNFSIALTGLQAQSVALNTIGNNLANLNTTAFKSQRTNFEDLFYQTIGTTGAGNSLQVGVGTRVSGTSTNFTQGSLSPQTTPTAMALSGDGFFLVQRGNNQALTRAGNFQLDSMGNLTTSGGESVMGYGVKAGAVDLNGGMVPLQLPLAAIQPAQATQNLGVTTALDASSPTGTQFSAPVKLFDSLGQGHASTVSFTKSSATTWDYTINLPAGDATGTPVKNSGTLTFDSSGKLTAPATNVSGVTFPGLANGAADLSFNFNLYSASGTPLVTQTTGLSNTSTTTQDGFAAGTYQDFSVGASGLISARFSNGQTTKVGQVAVATVANTGGLVRAGSNDYMATEASGSISAGVANTGGRGSIEGESLEGSNVDISAEFSELIVAQRAFEADSKTVTTFDAVTQQAIAMIR